MWGLILRLCQTDSKHYLCSQALTDVSMEYNQIMIFAIHLNRAWFRTRVSSSGKQACFSTGSFWTMHAALTLDTRRLDSSSIEQ